MGSQTYIKNDITDSSFAFDSCKSDMDFNYILIICKFMDGRVYIQTGKVLKPAQVVYHDTPPEPVPISNGDVKVASKNKLSGNSPGNKIPVASDLLSKQEVCFFFLRNFYFIQSVSYLPTCEF